MLSAPKEGEFRMERVCRKCGKVFEANDKRYHYCSTACRKAASNDYYKQYTQTHKRSWSSSKAVLIDRSDQLVQELLVAHPEIPESVLWDIATIAINWVGRQK